MSKFQPSLWLLHIVDDYVTFNLHYSHLGCFINVSICSESNTIYQKLAFTVEFDVLIIVTAS